MLVHSSQLALSWFIILLVIGGTQGLECQQLADTGCGCLTDEGLIDLTALDSADTHQARYAYTIHWQPWNLSHLI